MENLFMTDTDRKQFLNVLQAKEADIATGLGRRDGLAVQAEADVFDEIQDAIERALLVRNLDHGSDLLREVRNAVERIENGEYGPCQECGEEINPKRLAAVPWAALCLRCQEKADANSPIGNRERPSLTETIGDPYPESRGKVRRAKRRVAAVGRRRLSQVSVG
jgi:DnaK suppressor protein